MTIFARFSANLSVLGVSERVTSLVQPLHVCRPMNIAVHPLELSDQELNWILNDKVFEKDYSADHPEVISTVAQLHDRQQVSRIFSDFKEKVHMGDHTLALHVGAAWSNFTAFVPKLLCGLASKAQDNLVRHYLIQTAFEELGSRNHKMIHCELFDAAGNIVGFNFRSLAKNLSQPSLEELAQFLSEDMSDAEIIGVTLGLELPANENISTLISSIGYATELQARLLRTPFFQIHTRIEDEHIRLSVANLLRFCRNKQDLNNTLGRFDQAINFWRKFWGEISQSVITARHEFATKN